MGGTVSCVSVDAVSCQQVRVIRDVESFLPLLYLVISVGGLWLLLLLRPRLRLLLSGLPKTMREPPTHVCLLVCCHRDSIWCLVMSGALGDRLGFAPI